MNYRFATEDEVVRAERLETVVHEAISPEHGWSAYMHDPRLGNEAWWFINDHDGGRTRWVVGRASEWPGDEAATENMMAWYWSQCQRKE